MYFVDREKMEEKLVYIEKQIQNFTEVQSCETMAEKLAVERIVHIVTDALLDVGNNMIDGFIMRDPGSFEDILDILEDEQVITKEICSGLKELLPLRKALLQDYTEIDHQELVVTFNSQLDALKQFTPSIRKYLENELGPVTTFRS